MSGLSGQPVTFLFWNLAGRELSAVIGDAAMEHSVDICILAESQLLDAKRLLLCLNKGDDSYYLQDIPSRRLRLISRFSRSSLKPSSHSPKSDRRTMMQLTLPGRNSLLLAAVHLPSKLHASSGDQYATMRELSRDILRSEAKFRHRRTIVVGDFNMDPFEEGMQACDGLHALMSRREITARKGARRWSDAEYPMFFNPMWQCLGDRHGRPPGSYFYARSGVATQYWHMFDQFVLRPELAAAFSDEDVAVLDQIRGVTLLDQMGRPNRETYSDHLPLLFRLRF